MKRASVWWGRVRRSLDLSPEESKRPVLWKSIYGVAGLSVALALLYVPWEVWALSRDWRVDGDEQGDLGPSVFTLAVIGTLLGMGLAGVAMFRRGHRRTWAAIALATVPVVILMAGNAFTLAEAQHCECGVGFRHGAAEAVWLAFDTVPIVKINGMLGWEEPQTLADVGDNAETLAPFARWGPAIAARAAVAFVLLALAAELYKAVSSRGASQTRSGSAGP